MAPVRGNECGVPGFRRVALMLAAAVIVTLLLAAGCGDSASNAEGGAATAAVASVDTAETEATELTIESVRDEVSRIRGLPVKSDIDVSYINREQLAANLEKELSESYPTAVAAVEGKVLKQLNLIDQDLDLAGAASQMLTEGVLGYYDDGTGELKVVSDNDGISALDEVTLAHEITHALQDQNFSLTPLLPEGRSGNDDRERPLYRDHLGAGYAAGGECGSFDPWPLKLSTTPVKYR